MPTVQKLLLLRCDHGRSARNRLQLIKTTSVVVLIIIVVVNSVG
eukprot:COSAG06_NODE_91_length_24730_cov_26.482603_4_plen_44_part_00